MDLDKLNRAKEIQRQINQIQDYIDNFPGLYEGDFISYLLEDDYENYKKLALCTLNAKGYLLKAEFEEL